MTYQYKTLYEVIWAAVAAGLGALVLVMPMEMPPDLKVWGGVAAAGVARAVIGVLIAAISKRSDITAT